MKIFTYKDYYKISEDKHPNVEMIFDMLINHNVGLFILDKNNALSLTGASVSDTVH